MSRFRRLAPYFLLGPITGPLVAGVVINMQKGNRVLAGLYTIAAIEMTFLLPPTVAAMGFNTAGALLGH
jgi:hypothetical protein